MLQKYVVGHSSPIFYVSLSVFNFSSLFLSKELAKDLQCCNLKLEVKDLKTQIEFMKILASLQEQQHKQMEK